MRNPATGADGEHATFCRICEACCGLIAKVEGGRIVQVKPDKQNPHSQGHVCVKGMAFADLVYDEDRVTRPLKRVGGPGEFAPVSWDEALGDIAARLKVIRDRDGPESVAFYIGNPSSFATNMVMAHGGFMRAIGSRKGYSPGSQDTNARSVANFVAFGAAARNAFPDLPRCDFLMIFGGNPLVSNGSILFSPRIRHDLDDIAKRGRVIVVDPRASETARRYEHLAIKPNGDVWLLLAMLRVMLDEDLVDVATIAGHAAGFDEMAAAIRRFSAEESAARAGLAIDTVREIAQAFASARAGAAYGRVGVCRGPFATLTNVLLTALDVVSGHFGVPGGQTFGYPLLAGSEKTAPGGYGESTSRIGGIPTVVRYTAGAAMPDDITEPGPGQVKALMVTCGNPVLSAPGGARLEAALGGLELMVSFDMYVNETNRYADYVLPGTSFFERPDVPFVGMAVLMRPFVQYTDAVIDPVGESRHEHEVFQEIIERMGLPWPARGDQTTPLDGFDDRLRRGPAGDDFGTRDGWSFERLRDHASGVMLQMGDSLEGWRDRIAHPDRRIRLWHEIVADEFARLEADVKPAPALALIGRRDIRSINSWMHNIPRLVRSQETALLIHPHDAAARGIADGDHVRLWNAHGEIEIEASVTDEVVQGAVCYPHGWGHDGGWKRANAHPGRNINVLLGLGVPNVEFVSGTTLMDGIEVFVERIGEAASSAA